MIYTFLHFGHRPVWIVCGPTSGNRQSRMSVWVHLPLKCCRLRAPCCPTKLFQIRVTDFHDLEASQGPSEWTMLMLLYCNIVNSTRNKIWCMYIYIQDSERSRFLPVEGVTLAWRALWEASVILCESGASLYLGFSRTESLPWSAWPRVVQFLCGPNKVKLVEFGHVDRCNLGIDPKVDQIIRCL